MSELAEETELDFANRALWLGCKTTGITAFDGGDLEEQVAAVYWPHTAALLTLSLWRFNTNTVQLTRLETAPNVRWDYAYQLPQDRLSDPMVMFDDPAAEFGTQEFEIYEDELRCDVKACFIAYQRRPSSPAKWGAVFKDFALTSLAANLALLVNEDRSRFETLKVQAYGSLDENVARGKLGLALTREALSQPPVQLLPEGGPLIGAHWHGD